MMEFPKFPTLCLEFWIPNENAERFSQLSLNFQFFAPARPGCAEPCKTNGILYILGGLGAFVLILRENQIFHENAKLWKYYFLAGFEFFHENSLFGDNQQIAKTQIFL